MSETIFALATARGKAGVAIVRISGPNALVALSAFGVKTAEPRRASLRKLCAGDEVIDDALVLFFPKGQSFTGENIVEFQLHGSVAVIGEVLRILGDVPGLRPAVAGEFTRRAMENGIIDLTQVEGLADLIDAETEAQRRQAQRVLSGVIGERVAFWRKDLVRAAALVEATIDFADEDIPDFVMTEVLELVEGLHAAFSREIEGSRISERVRDGFEVALIGAPNSGKSSLLNALAGREAAITSEIAGTTRDVIEVRMDIGGLPVTLLDTAGLRETDDAIERMGVARAVDRAQQADLRIMLIEPGTEAVQFDLGSDDFYVYTKVDVFSDIQGISSKTGEGLNLLLSRIEGVLQSRVALSGVMIRDRQRNAMIASLRSLNSARDWLYGGGDCAEFVAADLRSASHSLEYLVGHIGVDTLLDEIFLSFCIGK
jgi:tRNA modification GTPase